MRIVGKGIRLYSKADRDLAKKGLTWPDVVSQMWGIIARQLEISPGGLDVRSREEIWDDNGTAGHATKFSNALGGRGRETSLQEVRALGLPNKWPSRPFPSTPFEESFAA